MYEDTRYWWENVVNHSLLAVVPSLAMRICEVAAKSGDEETIQLLSRLLLEMKAVGERVEAEVDQLLENDPSLHSRVFSDDPPDMRS